MSLFGKKYKLIAPLTGKLKNITEVNDITFAQKFLGDGVAIEPTDGVLLSPVEGKIVQVFHTKHAIGIESKGLEILIHIGMDTVELKGEGFTAFVNEGDKVSVGDKLVEFDIDFIKEKGFETDTAIVITNSDEFKSFEKQSGNVVAGQDEIMTVKK